MNIVMFYHSLRSCWNHGNAHFLRGLASELLARGHEVAVYEPRDGWSVSNLLREHGAAPLAEFAAAFPHLESMVYDLATLDLDQALDRAHLVLVHEWNPHELVARIGAHRARTRSYRLLFHDTHHRSVTDPDSMAAYDLRHYDGVLAFGQVVRDLYLERGWAQRAWTWHEAADTTVFRPMLDQPAEGEVVWIGNWGDGERTAELDEFLLEPTRALGLATRAHGVRYPGTARRRLASAGSGYGGWLPNHRVPAVFARYKVTIHVPRRPYTRALPGIPTIRPFEALASGIPLITSPWQDTENLFSPGQDFLVARDGDEMKRCLRAVLADEALARELVLHGHRTIIERHTCGHRVDELFHVYQGLGRELGQQRDRSSGSSATAVQPRSQPDIHPAEAIS